MASVPKNCINIKYICNNGRPMGAPTILSIIRRLYMKYFDSHAHYNDEKFDIDRDDILLSLPQNNVSHVINAGTNYDTSLFSINLAQKYSYIYAAVGIHPEDIDINNSIDKIKELTKHVKVIAIGEIGLDYYYDVSKKEIQKDYFFNQLQLANEVKLPVIVHDRDAHQDIWDILKSCPVDKSGVIHCYSGSLEMAKLFLNMGYYLGFGGTSTFSNAKTVIEVLNYIPLDRILIETDAPYLTPVPFRGKRNNSMYLKYVVEKIAEIKKVSAEEIADITSNNAKKLFNID